MCIYIYIYTVFFPTLPQIIQVPNKPEMIGTMFSAPETNITEVGFEKDWGLEGFTPGEGHLAIGSEEST